MRWSAGPAPATRRARSALSGPGAARGAGMRVAMIETGYVGLVSWACFADFGHTVTRIDKDTLEAAGSRVQAFVSEGVGEAENLLPGVDF